MVRARTRWLAAASVFLAGCSPISLRADPTVHARPEPLPVALYDVEWWVPLVRPSLLEYAPQEPAAPTVDPQTGRVIVLTRDGFVRSVSPVGGVEWEFKTAGPFNAGATVEAGVVYVPGGDGNLYALKSGGPQKDDRLLWKYAAGEELATTPVLTGGKVLVASSSDTLFAVDAATGKWLWQYRRDTPGGFTLRGAAAPKVASGKVYVGFSDGQVVALNLEDGTPAWERETTSGPGQFVDVDTTPVVEGGRVFVASYKAGAFAFDAATGEQLWQRPLSGVVNLTAQADVLFYTGDGEVGALDARDGRPLWSLPLEGRYGREPLLARGSLLVPTNNALLFVDPSTGKPKLSFNPGKGVTATPAWRDARLYVLSNLGYLYSLRLSGRGG